MYKGDDSVSEMVNEMVNTIRAYFTGLELDLGIAVHRYEYDEPYHVIGILDKSSTLLTKGFNIVPSAKTLFQLNDNNDELVMTVTRRFAGARDITYGRLNSIRYETVGNTFYFRYKIENIQQVKDLLIKYSDYIDYIVQELKGR